MKALVNHPGMQLRDDAADSLERLERDHGVVPITSAMRTVADQQALIDRYDHPKSKYDRPPYLYNPRRPASAGLHVKGTAFDTTWGDGLAVRALLAEYGFMFNYPYDKVHYEYDPTKDKHLNDVVKQEKPAKNDPIGETTVDIIISYGSNNSRNGITVCAPKLVKKLTSEQWGNGAVQKALKGVPIIQPVNDREYDILVDMYR